MAPSRRLGVSLVVLSVGLTVSTTEGPRAADDPSLRSVLASARSQRGATFSVPDEGERALMRTLVASLARRAKSGEVGGSSYHRRTAAKLGLEVVIAAAEGERFTVLREEHARRGRGVYVFRTRTVTPPTVIETPHGHYDTYTGDISENVFVNSDAFALFLNTVERYALSRSRSDVAHAEASLYHAAHLGLLDAVSDVRVIQPHGYADGGKVPDHIHFVINDGRRGVSSSQRAVSTAFSREFGSAAVGVYGEEVFVLGGTTNIQGRALNDEGRGRFIHLEISRTVRRGFMRDDRIRARLLRVLAKIIDDPWS